MIIGVAGDNPIEVGLALSLMKALDENLEKQLSAAKPDIPQTANESAIDGLLDYINKIQKEKKGDKADEAD